MLWQATRRGGLGPAVSRRRRSAVGHRWRRGCGRPGAGATAWTGGESEMPRVRSEGGARRAARDGGEACRGVLGWGDTNSCRLPSPRRPHNPVAVNLGWETPIVVVCPAHVGRTPRSPEPARPAHLAGGAVRPPPHALGAERSPTARYARKNRGTDVNPRRGRGASSTQTSWWLRALVGPPSWAALARDSPGNRAHERPARPARDRRARRPAQPRRPWAGPCSIRIMRAPPGSWTVAAAWALKPVGTCRGSMRPPRSTTVAPISARSGTCTASAQPACAGSDSSTIVATTVCSSNALRTCSTGEPSGSVASTTAASRRRSIHARAPAGSGVRSSAKHSARGIAHRPNLGPGARGRSS